MGIPLSTTTITVLRLPPASGFDDPYEGGGDADYTQLRSGIRAVIDHAAGSADLAGSQQNVADYHLTCDLVDLTYLDRIKDDKTGRTFRISWFLAYPDHVEAGIRDVAGEA